MKKTLAMLTLGTLTLAAEPNSSQGVLKHREHNGIGYGTGYTTAELFLAPKWKNNLLPFADLRGHVFDNGKFASNAGIGLRYNWSDFTLGGNFYYDFREAANLNPHQLAGGLEFLSKYMDIRFNGYGPIANTEFEKTPKFVKFFDNSALFNRRLKAALPMVEGEVGFPFGRRCGDWSMYGALGPYYLFKKTVNGVALGKAWGGQGRVELNLVNRYKMTALSTYDEIFKWTVQGSVGVSIPFRKSGETQNPLCAARNQLPYRQEIIPIQCESKSAVPPFNIIFVNNTSSSNGTAESPYPTLALAQANSNPGDVIYVFLGDGTATGMSGGITLQNRQRFHGSGASMDLGGFVVPALSYNRPTIRNTGGDVVTLANSNTVAGFNIVSSTGAGITKAAALGGSYLIADNSINAVTTAINLPSSVNCQFIVSGNHIFNTTNGGIIISSSNGTTLSAIQSNNLSNIAGNSAIQHRSTSTSSLGGLIAQNKITTATNEGIFCQTTNASLQNSLIKGNVSVPNNATNGNSALSFVSQNTSRLSFQAQANTLSSSFPTLLIESNQTSTLNGSIENCQILNQTTGDTVEVFPANTSLATLAFKNNTILASSTGACMLLNPATGVSVTNLEIRNNVMVSPVNEAFGFANTPGNLATIDLVENTFISRNTNTIINEAGGLFIIDVFSNVVTTANATSLSYSNADASTLTCTNIFGNIATGALSLSATAPATLQVESSTATKQGVVDANTFPGGITTTGNVAFVDPGTCP